MDSGDTVFQIEFSNSRQQTEISLSSLHHKTLEFLEHYAKPHLTGKNFAELVGEGSGEVRLARLLAATGFQNDAGGFFAELTRKLSRINGGENASVEVNSVEIPSLLCTALLELMMPGDKFISIKDVAQFENLTNVTVPGSERDMLQEVIDTYPVRLSMHALRQMRVSRAVGYQYAPFVQELDPVGQVNTWIGQFHEGLLEQMYKNRVIFLLNMSCPVYCRFCFRKHKDLRNQPNPTPEDVLRAVEYVRNTPTIKEIVITGGDPFLAKKNMMTAIDGLKEIPHVQTLRLATRCVSYYPHLFYDKDRFWLEYLKMKSIELGMKGKRIELATHFIHPDEVSIQALDIIGELVSNGIPVYVQTPFLKECNDRGPELVRLFSLLRGAGAELHYIYIPCSPIQGNSVYWAPISSGLNVAAHLRAHLSDRVIPRICTATPIGKIDWFSSGWAVEQDESDEHFIWIRTPYTPGFFKDFADNVDAQSVVRQNPEGTLDARFMAEIGDKSCFLGKRSKVSAGDQENHMDSLARFREEALQNQKIACSAVPVGSLRIARPHETRVELDTGGGEQELAYIRDDDRITDVLITSETDAIDRLHEAGLLIEEIRRMRHVNAVRLRSVKFNYDPGIYTGAVISRLARLNSLNADSPLRLEIETQFLHSKEIIADHGELASRLRRHGVTVYSNIPLLHGVNDTASEIQKTAYTLRSLGIEFHHLYVAGHPIQRFWSRTHPIDIPDVSDIASRVRMEGSGREIPRYIIMTELGEVDFGLTSRLFRRNGGLAAVLLPYDLEY
ncbi:MAG TPA: radical SAM protein, partial [Desulfobacteraceae bacterium]|nr:radical SAM protein [Desulfobacteraceae bacterium]